MAPGVTIKTVAQAEAAPLDALDYAAIGGVFATSSKAHTSAPIGPAGLARIADIFRRRAPKLPLCAIAGIDATNAADAIVAGVDGVAVISALSITDDPQAAARTLRDIVDGARARRGSR